MPDTLQPGVNRIAFQRQHPEDALMDASQRLPPHKSFQCASTLKANSRNAKDGLEDALESDLNVFDG
jgi:hypothetical protein